VSRAQPAEFASTNRDDVRGDAVRGALGRYLEDLAGQPLAARTREAYGAKVSAYIDWLAGLPGAEGALREPRARDFAARDFKRHLKLERRWAPSSVNLAWPRSITSTASSASARRSSRASRSRRPRRARSTSTSSARCCARPRRRLARDRAIVVVLLHTALRLSEFAAIDTDDVRVSARKGLVIVRSEKGDAHREVPLNPTARGALEAWLTARAKLAAEGEGALFVGRTGRRLSPRAIDLVVRKVAGHAGLVLSAHVLRHTCITKLVRAGHDVVLVAELAGHRRLETTRRYSLPSHADRQPGSPRCAAGCGSAPLQPALARGPPAGDGRPGGGGLMARAILTDAERLAWERFPAEPDPDVIGAFFTLADGEVDALRRLPTPAARLASAVALAGIRWLGFVPAELDQAPTAGVARLAGQLDVDPAVLVGYGPAERTAREHRQGAARLARFRDARGEDLDALENLLVERALEHDSPLGLLRAAVLTLRDGQLLRPALSTLERLVASARAPSARPFSAWTRCSTARRGGRWTGCA
jgi:integrase/recombinase XerC